jgi:hypothetical protein
VPLPAEKSATSPAKPEARRRIRHGEAATKPKTKNKVCHREATRIRATQQAGVVQIRLQVIVHPPADVERLAVGGGDHSRFEAVDRGAVGALLPHLIRC